MTLEQVIRDIEAYVRKSFGHQGPPRIHAVRGEHGRPTLKPIIGTTDDTVVSYFADDRGHGFRVWNKTWLIPPHDEESTPSYLADLLEHPQQFAQWLSWGGGALYAVRPTPTVEYMIDHPYWDHVRRPITGIYQHQDVRAMGSAPNDLPSAHLLADAMSCIERLDLHVTQINISTKGFNTLQEVAAKYIDQTNLTLWGCNINVDDYVPTRLIEIKSDHDLRTLLIHWKI